MKSILLLLILAFISCSKSEKVNENTNALNCSFTLKAIVKKQATNESGTEYFYYLSTNENISGSADVFPSSLTNSLQVEGLKVTVKYNLSEKMHKYVKCEPGHTMDPLNPDERTMPQIEVCSAAPSTL